MVDPRWPPLNDMTQFLRHRMSPAHAVDLIRCHTFNIQRVRGGGAICSPAGHRGPRNVQPVFVSHKIEQDLQLR